MTGSHARAADKLLREFRIKKQHRAVAVAEQEKLTPEKILRLIETAGGGATKDLIKTFLNSKETKSTALLEKLVAAGRLVKTSAALMPKTSRGRDLAFYALPGARADHANFKARQVRRCLALLFLRVRGYRYFRQLESGFFEVASDAQFESRSLLLTDEEVWNAPTASITRVINAWIADRLASTSEIFFAYINDLTLLRHNPLYDFDRLDDFVILTLLDLSALPQARSYRFKNENHAPNLLIVLERKTVKQLTGRHD